jgi:hypothetical protein
MRKSAWFRVLGIIVAVVALGLLPRPACAQRGGGGHGGGGGGFHGGGGGGFHGGGFSGATRYGGGHYSGGGYRGGYRGGGYGGYGGYRGWGGGYGWRGGWGGRYWGYPGYGWGWGFGLGFGWPWWGWGGYPYGYYGYAPDYDAYPDYDPYACPPGYSCPGNGNSAAPPPANSNPNSGYYPARSRRPSVPADPNDADYAGSNTEARRSNAPILSVDRITATPSSYRVARSPKQQDSSLSPEVRNAMHHLREMPPFARQREIETGRYSHFSPEEKEQLRHFE